jgi:hypothetical protein
MLLHINKDKAQEIFNNGLKHLYSGASAASVNINAISKVENDLTHLKNVINNKGPVTDVMKIVHGSIHPALLVTYNLQLRR